MVDKSIDRLIEFTQSIDRLIDGISFHFAAKEGDDD